MRDMAEQSIQTSLKAHSVRPPQVHSLQFRPICHVYTLEPDKWKNQLHGLQMGTSRSSEGTAASMETCSH